MKKILYYIGVTMNSIDKKSYNKPALKIHGDLKEITKMEGNTGGDEPMGSYYT